MKCLSLFSGIGGFDLALQRKGHEIVGACEIDKYARQVYTRHFPGVRIYEDATKLDPRELPDFDLLCAGFPCQPFSYAGKRLGFEESRGTLFFEIARIAREKRPQYLLLENVRGLLSHAEGKTFAEILSTLDEIGYDAEWQVLNSKYFLPHQRERVFIIGHLRGKPFKQIFPIGEIHKVCDEQESKTDTVAKCLTAGGHSGGLHSQMTIMLMHSQANGRPINYDNAFSLTTKQEQAVFDLKRYRRFTPIECERLQGFPDNWTKGLSDTQRYKCVGNAVTVPVIEYILSSMTLGFDGN